MEFGISFGALYADPQTYLRYSVEGEKIGYTYLFYPDSQTLYRDPFVNIGAASVATRRVKLGTLVSSIYTRHPTVLASSAITAYELSGGRFVLVVGAGDSAVRRIGMKPAPVQEFENSVKHLRYLIAGREFDVGTARFSIRFARHRVPIYVAATGKKMLSISGRVGDGSVIMVGPSLTKWAVGRVRLSCEEAGLDFENKELFWCGFCAIHEDSDFAKKLVKPSISHDLAVVNYMSDRVAVMYAGEIVEEGTSREVIEKPLHPYSQALIESVPDPRRGWRPRVKEIESDEVSHGCRFAPRCPYAFEKCYVQRPALTRFNDSRKVACFLHQ